MYSIIFDWLRKNVESDDMSVVSLAICTVERDIDLDMKKYDLEESETFGFKRKMEGLTHVARFLIVADDVPLVDGGNLYFKIEKNGEVVASELDGPDFNGGYFDEGMSWVSERAGRYT